MNYQAYKLQKELELVDQLKDFTIEVFNYFNGRINKINIDIKLIIDDIDFNLYGSYASNEIRINLFTIVKFLSSDGLKDVEIYKVYIIETVIHELYHSDQIIDRPRYTNDLEYQTMIEDQVESLTYFYITEHIYEISNIFKIDSHTIKTNINKRINSKALDDYYYYESKQELVIFLYCNLTLIKIDNIERINRVIDLIQRTENIYLKVYVNNQLSDDIIIKENNKININCLDQLYKYSILALTHISYIKTIPDEKTNSVYTTMSYLFKNVGLVNKVYKHPQPNLCIFDK